MKKFVFGVLVIIFISLLALNYFILNNRLPVVNQKPVNINQPVNLSFFAKILQRGKIVTETPTVTLIVAGDVMLGRSINYRSAKQNNFVWPFEKTVEVLKTADITFINLESPFVDNCPLTNSGMVFCSDQRNIQGLTFAGIDIVNLANNQIGNYGQEGIKQTRQLLEGNNMSLIDTTDGALSLLKK